MPSFILISDDEKEELNIVNHPNISSSSISPEGFLGKVSLKLGPLGQRKRRRSLDSDGEAVEVKDISEAKKAKREERKAVSIPLVPSPLRFLTHKSSSL